jgi:hypothetical protein
VNLSKDPGEVGNRLVYLINKNKDQIPHECEVCARAVARVVCRMSCLTCVCVVCVVCVCVVCVCVCM